MKNPLNRLSIDDYRLIFGSYCTLSEGSQVSKKSLIKAILIKKQTLLKENRFNRNKIAFNLKNLKKIDDILETFLKKD